MYGKFFNINFIHFPLERLDQMQYSFHFKRIYSVSFNLYNKCAEALLWSIHTVWYVVSQVKYRQFAQALTFLLIAVNVIKAIDVSSDRSINVRCLTLLPFAHVLRVRAAQRHIIIKSFRNKSIIYMRVQGGTKRFECRGLKYTFRQEFLKYITQYITLHIGNSIFHAFCSHSPTFKHPYVIFWHCFWILLNKQISY